MGVSEGVSVADDRPEQCGAGDKLRADTVFLEGNKGMKTLCLMLTIFGAIFLVVYCVAKSSAQEGKDWEESCEKQFTKEQCHIIAKIVQ
jgi:hypothetical protein